MQFRHAKLNKGIPDCFVRFKNTRNRVKAKLVRAGVELHTMKGNGFDEEDFYIAFFVLWSLGVLVIALWCIFLDLKLRSNRQILVKSRKDQCAKDGGRVVLIPDIPEVQKTVPQPDFSCQDACT
jgi:hypothetical protein